MRGYSFLLLAILFEVFGSTMLKLSKGFTVLVPTIILLISFGISFIFLGLSLKSLPLSTAYAIWSGLGTALVAIVGFIYFSEEIGVVKVMAIALIILGIVVLNKSQATKGKMEQA